MLGVLQNAQRCKDLQQSMCLMRQSAVQERVVRSMFATFGFAKCQTDSYERFMHSWVPHIIAEVPPVVVDSDITGSRHVVKRGQIKFTKPTFQESGGTTSPIYPYHCRWRNLTYTANLLVDTTHEIYDIREDKKNPKLVETRTYQELPYGEIPAMRKSSFCHTHSNPYLCNECPSDEAGIFIVNGSEKNVVGQLKMRSNAVFVWQCKQPNKQLYVAELRSCHESKVRSTSTLTATISRYNEITVMVPFITFAIPVGIIFRALGVLTTQDMEAYILPGHWVRDARLRALVHIVLENYVYKDDKVMQSDEALYNPIELHEWIGKRGTKEATREKRIKYVEHIFGNEFLPHIGLERNKETVRRKLFMFGNMIRRLCLVRLGQLPCDDRDHVATQRVDTIGSLMAYLMRPLFRNQLKHLGQRIKRSVDRGKDVNIMELLQTKKITARFRYHFSTGNWSVTNTGQGNKGVAQMHQRMTVGTGLSNLRRLNSPVNKEGKLPKPRQLHPSQWGVMCCFETPEGSSCVTPDTRVVLGSYMDQVTIAELCNIAPDHESVSVLTVNPTTLQSEPSRIYNQFTKMPDGPMFRLTTITGRQIRCTHDHPFLTQRGWVYAQDLDVQNDRLCIMPDMEPVEPDVDTKWTTTSATIGNDIVILTEDLFVRTVSAMVQPHFTACVGLWMRQLRDRGFLPLSAHDARGCNNSFGSPSRGNRIGTLARLLGFKAAKGSVFSLSSSGQMPRVNMRVGRRCDAQEVVDDIRSLGFDAHVIRQRHVPARNRKSNGRSSETTLIDDQCNSRRRHFVGAHYVFSVSMESLMFCLLAALDTSLVSLPQQQQQQLVLGSVPSWVMQTTNRHVQREWLAGFLGGSAGFDIREKSDHYYQNQSMSGIRLTGCRSTIHISPIQLFCRKSQQSYSRRVVFAKQVQSLLDLFDVETGRVGVFAFKKSSRLKSMNKVIIPFLHTSTSSTLTLLNKIGVRYNQRKLIQCRVVGEYVRLQQRCYQKRRMDQLTEELMPLSTMIGCYYSAAASSSVLPSSVQFCLTMAGSLRSFIQQCKPGPEGTLWVPLECKQRIAPEPVMDFTTVSNNHSFVANGFVTHNCGLIKNLALGAHVRAGYDPQMLIRELLNTTGLVVDLLQFQGKESNSDSDHTTTYTSSAHDTLVEVLVNGILIGYTREPDQIVRYIRQQRRSQNIMFDTSVAYWPHRAEVCITTDSGDMMRPCFVIENLHRFAAIWYYTAHDESLLWKELMVQGVVEYIDKDEESTLRVATTVEEVWEQCVEISASLMNNANNDNDLHQQNGSSYDATSTHFNGEELFTHMEIDPTFIMGVVASMLPFSNQNQAPRSVLYSAMAKQPMADSVLNQHLRPDVVAYNLWYPQRPLVRTMTENIVNKNGQLPSGVNATVMVLIFTGFTQEDSILLRESWVQSGSVHADLNRVYRDEEKPKGIDPTQFERPDPETCKGIRDANYSKLGLDGVVPPGTLVVPGDVLIGKTMNTMEVYFGPNGEQLQRSIKRDQSQLVRGVDTCYVEQVQWTTNRDGARAVRVKTRALRLPEIGDKFAMRHGQKGTVGMIVKDSDMPFLPDGTMPDVVINVHMWPSRMTIGLLSEMHLGMASSVACKEGDGTPFRDNMTFEEFGKVLVSRGYSRYGKYAVMSGATGERIEALAYLGKCYIMRLKHLAKDKAHVRNTGPVQIVTRQPVEGRANEGGLRFGEMERDVLIAHGSMQFLSETLNDRGDANISPICRKCGLLSISARPAGTHIRGFVLRAQKPYCKNCGTGDYVVNIKIPYACKLLLQEIYAMGGVWRLRISDEDDGMDVDSCSLTESSVADDTTLSAHTTTQLSSDQEQQRQKRCSNNNKRYVIQVETNMTMGDIKESVPSS